MIKSTLVSINKTDNFDNLYIESELIKRYKDIVRWAIVDINDKNISVCVSYSVKVCNKQD